MAVSIDARVGQREIDAAREGGADIEGVTSTQGTPVSNIEQQITFGGYPNQIGPKQIGPSLISKKGLLNKDPAWNTVDIINSLHPDFVANASPAELDHAVSVVQGKVDYGVTETLSPSAGAIEMQNREIQAQNEELDRLIAQLTLENEQARQQIRRNSVSPWMAEVRMPTPEWSTPAYGGTPVQEDLGTGFAPDFFSNEANWGAGDYLGPPTFVEDESAWGAGDYLGAPTLVEDESAWGAGGYTPVNPFAKGKPIDSDYPNLTFEQWQDLVENKALVTSFDPKFEESISHLVDVPKTKATAKSKYGAWNGKFNKLTAKQNLKNLATFEKAWMTDFENKFGSAKHWGLTRPTVNGKQISWEDNRFRNKVMRTDEFSMAYDSVYGISKGAKMIGSAYSSGLGFVGPALQNMINKKGAGNANTFKQTLAKVKDPETGAYLYEGEAEVAPTHPRETVSGGFWGLMSFAKENKKLFESLSGDELWALVSDPDEFWAFYEDALNAQ